MCVLGFLYSSWPGSSRPSTSSVLASISPCFEPGSRPASPRLSGMTLATLGLLGSLCSVLGAPLFAVLHALGVEHAAQDVIAHARKVFHATAADHDHRVLLQVM